MKLHRYGCQALVLSLLSSVLGCGSVENEDAVAVSENGDELQLGCGASDWPMAQHDARASSNQGLEGIGRRTELSLDWTFQGVQAGREVGPIHATPVVGHGLVYVGSLDGYFYAIDEQTGALVWSMPTLAPNPTMASFFALTGATLTATPILGGAVLPSSAPYVIFGDADGNIYCRDAFTGAEIWTIHDIEAHPLGGIGGNSLSFAGDTLYAGTSSVETFALVIPGGSATGCCTHLGTLAAINIATGAESWRYQTVPTSANQALPPERAPFTRGPSGADIWGQPTVDEETNTVYITTGQNLSPNADGTSTQTSDAFIALNATTGAPRWIRQVTSGDVWINGIAHPDPANGRFYDQDIGDSPHLYRLLNGRKVVAAGQKSGAFHVLDAATGTVITSRQVLHQPRPLGGFQQGGAHGLLLNFQHGLDGTPTAWDGIVTALSGDGSRTLWTFRQPNSPMVGGIALARGIVFVQSPRTEAAGAPAQWSLLGLHPLTGEPLARIDLPGRSVSSPVIANDRIVVGGGNRVLGELGTQNQGSVMSIRMR